MQQEFISNFNQYGKTIVNSAKELAAINSRFAGKILENQIGLAKFFVESSEKQLRVTEDANSPAEYVNKQTALVEEFTGKLSDATQASAKLAQDANDELSAWFKNGVKQADEVIKETSATVISSVETAPAVATKTTTAKKVAAKKKTSSTKPKTQVKKATASVKPAKAAKKSTTTAKKPAVTARKASPKKAAPINTPESKITKTKVATPTTSDTKVEKVSPTAKVNSKTADNKGK